MPVVVVYPAVKHRRSLRRAVVGDAISPLAQRRLNEALRLAVGLRAVGAGEMVSQAQLSTGGGKVARAKWRAVVGQHAAHGYAELAEILDPGLQKSSSAAATFGGLHLGEPEARVIIHSHKQVFPAIARVAGDSVSDALDAPELL